jgi:hypothetical protein
MTGTDLGDLKQVLQPTPEPLHGPAAFMIKVIIVSTSALFLVAAARGDLLGRPLLSPYDLAASDPRQDLGAERTCHRAEAQPKFISTLDREHGSGKSPKKVRGMKEEEKRRTKGGAEKHEAETTRTRRPSKQEEKKERWS